MTHNPDRSIPWRKATPDQIMGDGDEILAALRHYTTGKWTYDILVVRCDEDSFDLEWLNNDTADLNWNDLEYWCYLKDIPAPEESDAT